MFAEQIGLPLPSLPFLLGAGALAGTGSMSLSLGIQRVRPLAGGLAGWRERGFPLSPLPGSLPGGPGGGDESVLRPGGD